MSERTPNDPTDPMWLTHMQTLTKRMKRIEISTTIDQALYEYYSEKGMEVPVWRRNKDPQWWIDYLDSLDQK